MNATPGRSETGLTAERVCDVTNELGEGPVWSVREACLWWVDIRGHAVFRYCPSSGTLDRFNMPTLTGAVALRAQGGLLLALKGGIHVFDPQAGSLDLLTALEPELSDNRPNEGRCDASGRFWLGTMVDLAPRAGGGLYRIDAAGNCTRVMKDIWIPNSIRWSPDARTMYFSDTRMGDIWAFDFDADTGAITNRRVFVPAGSAPGAPDGSAVDTDGGLWNVRHGAGCIVRFTPDGKCDRVINVPVSPVTACTFGGDDLSTLFITSAWQHMSAAARKSEPDAGAVFAVETGVQGLPENLFSG